jgi:hypothetical protein
MRNAKTGKHLVKSAKAIRYLRIVPQDQIIASVLKKITGHDPPGFLIVDCVRLYSPEVTVGEPLAK